MRGLRKKHLSLMVGASVLVSANSFAAGFEKNILWSGKYTGIAGAATPIVLGAESLYYNPAGLASGRQGMELSGNFSPTWGQFSGPIVADNTKSETGYKFSPVYGVMASYNPTPQWGIGIGSYVSAGTKAIYEDVSFAGLNAAFSAPRTIKSDLNVIEFALGTGYEIMPGLRIGASYRVIRVNASFALVGTSGAGASTQLVQQDYENLGATRWNGFKLGVQYQSPEKTWGLGATYRSQVDFTAKGDVTVRSQNLAGTQTDSGALQGAISAAFPTQLALGGYYEVLPKNVKVLTEYVWTELHKNQVLYTETPTTTGQVMLGWRNQTNIRLATECTALPNWAFRAGYVWTSQVTPNEYAKANLAPPGAGHTITVGAGTQLIPQTLDVDAAVERSWTSGTGVNLNAPGTNPSARVGDYNASAWVLHTGVTYRL